MSYSRIIYCGSRGSSFGLTRFFRAIMFIESLTDYVNTKISQKYYKGTDDPLYFPYVDYGLKKCPKVKISCHYYGLKCDKIIFDEFPLPDWVKENDPSLSGKLSGITVKKNW